MFLKVLFLESCLKQTLYISKYTRIWPARDERGQERQAENGKTGNLVTNWRARTITNYDWLARTELSSILYGLLNHVI